MTLNSKLPEKDINTAVILKSETKINNPTSCNKDFFSSLLLSIFVAPIQSCLFPQGQNNCCSNQKNDYQS